MEENNSTTSASTSEITQINYFNLLQKIDKLFKFSFNSNNSVNMTKNTLDGSEIDIILNNITQNIDRILEQMSFEKKSMFIITILNTLVRVCAVHESLIIISKTSFESVFETLDNLIWSIRFEDDHNSSYAYDLLDSTLTNLAKDDLAHKCLKRLLSNETISTIDSDINNEESSQDNKIGFHKVVNDYIGHISRFIYWAVIQSAHEFRKNHSSLMITLLININNCLIDTDKALSLAQIELISMILDLICSLTDKVTLIPMFVSCGYVEKTIQWIRTDVFASHINDWGTALFTIVHNLSRDKIGLKQLRTEKAFDILKERKQLVNDRNEEKLTKLFGSALISLSTNDDTSNDNKILILDTSKKLYEHCMEAGKSEDFKDGGYHLSELMELLHRALSNTYVIKDLMENNTNENSTPIEYFPKLLLSIYGLLLDREADDLEKRAAEYLLKILLQISSYPEYREKLVKNNEFCVIIESLANRPKQDDAKRIWSNLQQQISPEESQKDNLPMIYISYDWADQQFCKDFVNHLNNKITIPIWVDYEHIEYSDDDMWEYLSSKITLATHIIVLVSTAYEESIDKFQELSFIISNNKLRNQTNSIIVVKAEPNFSFNRSWMKDLLHGKIIIPFDNHIENITSRVRGHIVITKKSFFSNCFSRSNRNQQRKTIKSDESSPDSMERLIDSDPRIVNRSTTYNESKTIGVTSDTIIECNPGTKTDQYSIVSSLNKQTGSIDNSTWV